MHHPSRTACNSPRAFYKKSTEAPDIILLVSSAGRRRMCSRCHCARPSVGQIQSRIYDTLHPFTHCVAWVLLNHALQERDLRVGRVDSWAGSKVRRQIFVIIPRFSFATSLATNTSTVGEISWERVASARARIRISEWFQEITQSCASPTPLSSPHRSYPKSRTSSGSNEEQRTVVAS